MISMLQHTTYTKGCASAITTCFDESYIQTCFERIQEMNAVVCDLPYPVLSVCLGCGVRLLGIYSLTFETMWWSHL